MPVRAAARYIAALLTSLQHSTPFPGICSGNGCILLVRVAACFKHCRLIKLRADSGDRPSRCIGMRVVYLLPRPRLHSRSAPSQYLFTLNTTMLQNVDLYKSRGWQNDAVG